MSLRDQFSTVIWNRGQEYYRSSRVLDFRASGRHFTATVWGTKKYAVDMTVSEDRVLSASCSCPYAADGTRCKHMAALAARVMYYQARERKVTPKTVHPFGPEAEDATPSAAGYFSVDDSCRRIEVSASALDLARQYITEGNSRLTGIEHGFVSYMNEPALRISGQFTEGRLTGGQRAVITRDRIYDASCDIIGCYSANNTYGGTCRCCEHVLATLLLARKELARRPLSYGTDKVGASLMSFFEDSAPRGDMQDRTPSVRLEPRVIADDYGKVFVDFRCGTDKLYVVKNAAGLFNAEQRRESYEADSLKIDFSQLTFAEDCRALADWANDGFGMQYEILQNAAQTSRVSLRRSDLNRLLLVGAQLDSFFDWGLGRTLTMLGASFRKVTLQEGRLDLTFKVSPRRDKSGSLIGVSVTANVPPLQFTERYIYYLEDGRFLRADAEALKPIRRVLESAGGGENISFSIGHNELAAFYRTVLPTLRRCAQVVEVEPEAIVRYIPPEPAFSFYLDVQDGSVLMQAKVSYGDEEHMLYDGEMLGRDAQAEARVAQKIAPLFTEWDPVRQEYALEADEERLYRFLTEDMDLLASLGEVHVTDRFAALRVHRRWSITAGVSLDSGVLNLTLLSDELSQEELAELLQAYAAKKRYHRLKDGSFISMAPEELSQLDALFDAAHVPLKEFVTGHMHLPQYRALYLDKVLEEHNAIVSNRSRHYRELIKTFKTIADSDFETPESLRGTLRPYQTAGYQWLMTLYQCGFGGILADDMGLGKTLQMIAVFEHLRQTRPGATHLVVCPASLVYNWIDEIHRFAPELKATPIAGTRDARAALIAGGEHADVLVTSYDLFKRDVAAYEALSIDIAVLDEAQFIKNQSSAAARSVKALRCAHRFAMTGTPVENRLSELWSIFDFLMPGFLYGYDAFRRELETPIVKHEDGRAQARLRGMVAPFVLRRLKKDVLRDLPAKNEEQRRVPLEGRQRKLYDAQVLKLKRLLNDTSDEDFRHSKIQVLAELTRLRQICCDPSLLYDPYEDESAKRDALMELLTTAVAGGHKVLVFSQFTSMLSLIEADLNREGLSYMLLTGETDKKERLRLANSFNQDQTNVFLISLRAGGTGLNLVGADIVVHYDPWWNYAVEQQATDRAHRIGQTRAVTVYKLIAKDTVEERIVALQDSKRDLAEGILSGDSVSLKDLSREDLLELIGS